MSNYYKIKCVTCDKEMDEGINRGQHVLIAVVKHQKAVGAITMAGGEITCGTQYLEWFVPEHMEPGCQLVVMSEYDDHYFDGDGVRHEVEPEDEL